MKKQLTSLCFGEILWDIFHCQHDEKAQNESILGGAPSNLCYYLNALGNQSTLISQVGNDALGDEAIQVLESFHIPHIIPKSTLPTGKVDIYFHNNEPTYQFNMPAAWDAIPLTQTMLDTAINADIIAFGSLAHRYNHEIDQSSLTNFSFETLQSILRSNTTAQRFLDLNLRDPHYHEACILELLSLADILKINQTEFSYLQSLLNLAHLSTRDALYQMIQQLNLNFIILTLGANGSIIMSENDYSAKSALKIDLVDTVGAGDAFSAGLLTALHQGASFSAAHDFANHFSSYICTQKGAFVPIPNSFKEKLEKIDCW